jgi:hypothetical protein
MVEEKDERMRIEPMSSAIARRRFENTSIWIGSAMRSVLAVDWVMPTP